MSKSAMGSMYTHSHKLPIRHEGGENISRTGRAFVSPGQDGKRERKRSFGVDNETMFGGMHDISRQVL